MSVGDHISVRRFGYSHHGVEIDDDLVVHFTGTPGQKTGARICCESIGSFANGGTVRVVEYGKHLEPAEVVKRAESRIGESEYHLYGNNCEHFARWCLTGDHKSRQINAANAAAGVGASTVAAAGTIGVVSATGTAAGLSGAGIMSGLATAGSAVGAGAVGGLVVLGILPGAASATVTNVALRDDDALPDAERSARRLGRGASVVGMAGGSAGAIVTVSAAGSVTGLSAAGITSGLAAVGATVGGGMAAGTVLVLAAPATAAAGIGYGSYRLRRAIITPSSDDSRVSGRISRERERVSRLTSRLSQRVQATKSALGTKQSNIVTDLDEGV